MRMQLASMIVLTCPGIETSQRRSLISQVLIIFTVLYLLTARFELRSFAVITPRYLLFPLFSPFPSLLLFRLVKLQVGEK